MTPQLQHQTSLVPQLSKLCIPASSRFRDDIAADMSTLLKLETMESPGGGGGALTRLGILEIHNNKIA